MKAPLFHSEHTLGRSAPEGDARLVTFDLPELVEAVTYTSDEVTSFCPVTGQPDFYEVEIDMWGSRFGIESKSLKLYLQSFNDKEKAQFGEQFAQTILQDVRDAVPSGQPLPFGLTVRVTQKPRGGVAIKSRATLTRGSGWRRTNENLGGGTKKVPE